MQIGNFWQKTIASVLINAIVAAFCAPSSFCLDKSEWVLEQRHFNNGSSRIYITDDAILINNISRGFQIVARAPDWLVEIFRADRKAYYKTDLEHFKYFTAFGVAGTDATSTLQTERKFLATKHEGDLILNQYDLGKGCAWLVTNLSKTPQVLKILAIYNQSPLVAGVITSYSLSTNKHPHRPDKENVLLKPRVGMRLFSTAKISRYRFNSSDFRYPVNYSEVKSYSELLTKKVSEDEVNWFMRP